MVRIRWKICLLGSLLAMSAIVCQGQPHHDDSSNPIPSGIAWYGVLADGIADAKATNRPILLLAAAPQCAGVPGMW